MSVKLRQRHKGGWEIDVRVVSPDGTRHARTRKRVKRGAAWERVALEMGDLQAEWAPVDALDLHAALEELAALDPIQAQIVELRFFGGLTVEEVAHLLGVSKRKVEGDWMHAKAWLKGQLDAEPPP